tara:strand:+ start:6361 stop:6603 length:243 start_codon:yes stop_codon:yes gene_type:complete
MLSQPTTWFWIALTAVCFALGFALSWIRTKRRVTARYQAAVEAQIKRRIQEEILRRVTGGPELKGNSGETQLTRAQGAKD